MYYSQLLVNGGASPDRPRPGRLWLRNTYRVHQRLCMGFPAEDTPGADPDYLAPFEPGRFRQTGVTRGDGAGFLFRIDAPAGGSPVILVQSGVEPDWDYAFRNASHLLAAPPQIKSVRLAFEPGQVLRFRLRANPTVKRCGGRERKNGPRLGLFERDEQ